jgi:hypothetical protein
LILIDLWLITLTPDVGFDDDYDDDYSSRKRKSLASFFAKADLYSENQKIDDVDYNEIIITVKFELSI